MNEPESKPVSDVRARVRRLHPRVISKIAAGEMILRPYSVVKELLENAIDADARFIEILIGETPDQLLEVRDDGVGMSREDLELALEAHATSKLSEEIDLLAVRTLGFRGEALPSIGRVSRLELTTADGETPEGWRVLVDGGHIGPFEPAGRSRGTTVRVADLFFNSPVRKRFLKGPQGEVRLVNRLVVAMALAHPWIGFRLLHRGQTVFDLPAAEDLAARVTQIHGPSFLARLLPLECATVSGSIRGYVGVPELARPGTQHQLLMVNRRWVVAPWFSAGLRQGFGDLLPLQRHPFAIVLLELDPSRIDVNVHPTKREVRFLDESRLTAELTRSVRRVTAALAPTWNLEREDRGGGALRDDLMRPRPAEERADSWPLLFGAGLASDTGSESGFPGVRPSDESHSGLLAYAPPAHPIANEGADPRSSAEAAPSNLIAVWQLHDRYLFAQTRGGLLVIDQHAAHERVLYEQAIRSLEEHPAPAQQLLFPVVVHLEAGAWAALLEYREDLVRLGVEAEEFGQETALLRAVPVLWTRDPEGYFRELLMELEARNVRTPEERYRFLAANFACRSAVRSGQSLTLEERNALIDQLFATRIPHGDPHGRPTFIQVPLADLDRRFGRSH